MPALPNQTDALEAEAQTSERQTQMLADNGQAETARSQELTARLAGQIGEVNGDALRKP